MCKQKADGYQICFDNLNIQRKARHQTSKKLNPRYDLIHGVAFKDRVNVEDLSDDEPTLEMEKVGFDLWLLSQDQKQAIYATVTEIVKRILCRQMKCFREHYNHLAMCHIPHKYVDQMKRKSTIVSICYTDRYIKTSIV